MDSSIVAMEESRSDLAASASKSVGAIVKIDSISIDINCSVEGIQPDEHDHFSIREFVAGMWEKNRKTCMPFGTEDITTERSTAPENLLAVRNNVGTNSHDLKNDSSLSCDVQKTGGGNRSSCSEDDDLCNKMIVCSLQCTEEHKGSRAQTDVRDDDDVGGNSPTHVVEAVPLHIIERDPIVAVENPSIRELENASSGSDFRGSSAAHRRRRKLRSLVDIMDGDKNSTGEKSRKGSTDAEVDLEPQLSAEVSKGTKSPPRKKKNVHEEDIGQPLGNPTSASKRLKHPILSAEKTSSKGQIVDAESEDGASALLDLRENARSLQNKPKKNKSVDTSRKTKQMHIDSRVVPIREVPKIKEVEPHFLGFVSGQQMDRISKLSKGKALVLDPQQSPLVHPSKISVKDHNVQGELALNLSLNSYVGKGKTSNSQVSSAENRGIPDLNESFSEKVPVMQGKELPAFSEKRNSTLVEYLETSVSCSEGAVVVSQPQALKNVDNNAEPDDIPMDIVELMAKNQRERALENSKQHVASEGINNSVRSSAFYSHRPPGPVNFPFTYTRGNMVVSQGISNFPWAKKCQLGTGNLFSSFTPSQPYPASSLGQRSNEGADLFWPPRQMNASFYPSVNQNHSIQHRRLNLHSFSDFGYKGKSTFSGAKGNEINTLWNTSAVNEGKFGSSSKSVRSADAHCNDTIPAMQLLSLMDQGISSSSSYKVGLNCFHDKHLSPCRHHPQMKANENQNDPFLNASLFLQSHSPEITRLINSVSHLQGPTTPDQGSSKTVPGTTKARPPNDLELGVCTLSRNPADFSTPEEGNEFTISCKDLKSRKRNDTKKRNHPNNADGHKKVQARKNSRK